MAEGIVVPGENVPNCIVWIRSVAAFITGLLTCRRRQPSSVSACTSKAPNDPALLPSYVEALHAFSFYVPKGDGEEPWPDLEYPTNKDWPGSPGSSRASTQYTH